MLDKKTQSVEGHKNIVTGGDLNINISTTHVHMLQQETEIQKNYRRVQSQLSQSSPELAIGEFLSAGELTQYKISGEKDFLKLLSKYSPSLPINIREEILRNIMSSAWHTIVFQPFFSSKLIEMGSVNGNEIMHFLQILCKISLKKSINPSNLKEFILLLTKDEYAFSNGPLRAHKALVAQVIMHCFYHQCELLESSIVTKELSNLAYKSDSFWDEFFVDLYFRYICNHIHTSQHLLLPVKFAFERYILTYPTKPLSRLAPIMISPYEFFRKHNREDFENNITDIAIDCRNHYE
jgi:hypothetical protein